MDFRIEGLDPTAFAPFYGLSEDDLAEKGIRRMIADSKPGYPDRVELEDADIGQPMLLLNFEHLPVDTPYRSSHAIFVREGADQRFDEINVIPEVMRPRMMSLRAFDSKNYMVDADLIEGAKVESLIAKLFENEAVEYIHAHYARRGCYSALITRG